MPTLTATAGPDAGTVFALDGTTVVGRHSVAGARLADTRVSRRHCELRPHQGGYRLVDLGSGNGTRVNGHAVQSADLRPGDRVEIGDTMLVYSGGATPSVGPTVIVRAGPAESGVVRTLDADPPSLLRAPGGAGTDWLRDRLACLAALYEATDAVSRILDVDELLSRIMELALRTADADHGVVLLADAETGELAPKAARGIGGAIVVSRSIADSVLGDGRAVLLRDAAADDRFRGQESVARHGLREVICAPLKGRHGTLGVLFLGTTAGAGERFTSDHLTLAAALAHQAALAVEETRYHHALVQAERLAAVGQAMAALSHHVKNIMQGVQFGGDLVRMGLAQDDKPLLAQGWKLVERNQARIDELILDMLNYSKERPPGIESVRLAEIVSDVAELVAGRAAECGVELRLELGDVPAVPCDPEGVHRALLNVVGNAIDAVEESEIRAVTVGLSCDELWVEIAVTDSGPGIDPGCVEELFKPFVSSKGSRGTGLGLPVSRKVLREHGGDLVAEALDGGGSRFVLRLPLVAGSAAE